MDDDRKKSLGSSERKIGTAKIIKIDGTRKTILQWKRIGHVMLFSSSENLSQVDRLPDLARSPIDLGYERLYRAEDQPFGDDAWKTLSAREIDYYKELLEEWGSDGRDDE